MSYEPSIRESLADFIEPGRAREATLELADQASSSARNHISLLSDHYHSVRINTRATRMGVDYCCRDRALNRRLLPRPGTESTAVFSMATAYVD